MSINKSWVEHSDMYSIERKRPTKIEGVHMYEYKEHNM